MRFIQRNSSRRGTSSEPKVNFMTLENALVNENGLYPQILTVVQTTHLAYL